MSNSLAIAAVTRTLRNLIDTGIRDDLPDDLPLPDDVKPTSEIEVTTSPLDKARDTNNSKNQINLFLYHTTPNAAWRNMDVPRQVKPGETAQPLLALNLYYLITAYGQNNNELISHLLLGQAARVLHDHAVLNRSEIENALSASELQEQIERVRITPQPLSLEEMSKLWTTFQTQYRISIAYEVSVVLIESKLPTKAPLPVLTRGRDDRGVNALAAPSPSLLEVRPPNRKPSAELGDMLTIYGEQLDSSDNLTVRFRNPQLSLAIAITPLPERSATELKVKLPGVADEPEVPANWPAGFYTLSIVIERPNLPSWTTNELALALAPQIEIVEPAVTEPGQPPEALQGDVPLTLTCIPQVRSGQKVVLLFGDREVPVESVSTPADATAATTLTFLVKDALPGIYVLRLRVDGVDSIPVNFTTTPPQFANNQKVKINE